eukprot:CAMPEP_0197533978 /NCGR_PEP_ID=MMETSP1318-20131121/45554_1 /TAXON_ID=552666 /ORGANISM="Partenskyella glossopodia, Strain RCC365" /LENGTH=38 /DNA_ID= /DNA_START= /DNA_END= /DNA_ORIENTATION=
MMRYAGGRIHPNHNKFPSPRRTKRKKKAKKRVVDLGEG